MIICVSRDDVDLVRWARSTMLTWSGGLAMNICVSCTILGLMSISKVCFVHLPLQFLPLKCGFPFKL